MGFSVNEFINYVIVGLFHVLDFAAYDHIIFLIVLTVVFKIKQWKQVVVMVSLFTVGHSVTLFLASYEVLELDIGVVELLIPITILITSFSNIVNFKLFQFSGKQNLTFACVFGLIHGLGFSNYFRMLLSRNESKLLPLLEFAIGIELAQMLVVGFVLLCSIFGMMFMSKRNWVIFVSSVVMVLSVQMIYQRWLW